MSNVIKADFKGEDEKNGYSTQDGSVIGVINKTTGLELFEPCKGEFDVFKSENTQCLDRKEMAQFLWMAAHLLDSEGRYKFDEYVGLNYDDEK
jgi:hypothetical protein